MKRGWLILSVIAAFFLSCAIFCTSVVQLQFADLYMEDLPAAFDGTTLIYLTDAPEGRTGLLSQLSQLAPDYVLLGGNLPARSSVFYAELGRYFPGARVYAALGEDDARKKCENATLLVNNIAFQSISGERISIVGLDAWNTEQRKLSEIAQVFSEEDFTIVLTSDAQSLAAMGGTACLNGSRWADLVLAAGTDETRYPYGWTQENGSVMLVSKGASRVIGAQAHCITLHCTDQSSTSPKQEDEP